MRVFVDTSALYALLDEDDAMHQAAQGWLSSAGRNPSTMLVTHNYVVVETAALVQHRLGRTAVRVLFDAWIPALSVFFVDEELHRRAVAALGAGGSKISLVDHTSFQLMRDLALDGVFAFDSGFDQEGFTTVP